MLHPGEVYVDSTRLEFIKDLALQAGRLTLEGYGRCGQTPKDGGGDYDISTEYDLRTERLVVEGITGRFGEPVLGEEYGLIGDREQARQRLWIVDPIDGTFNYQRGIPLYGVSIAYCKAGVPAIGVVYLPVLGQLFYASQGQGAFLEERPLALAWHQGRHEMGPPVRLSTSPEREVNRLIIDMSGQQVHRLFAACDAVGFPQRSMRHLVSAVVSLAYIAAGRMNAYLHTSLNLWDCAAVDILLREAGAPAPSDHDGVPM
jgi:myo-inositol-1(or 4)-monophosphatase